MGQISEQSVSDDFRGHFILEKYQNANAPLKQKPQATKGTLVTFLLFKNIFRPKRMVLTIPWNIESHEPK